MMTQSWTKTCGPGNSSSRAVAQINKLFAKRTELSESCRNDSSGARLYTHRPTCPVSNQIETRTQHWQNFYSGTWIA